MSETSEPDGTMRYTAREVVGVFPTQSALETAIQELEIAGVDRAAISVLGGDPQRSGRVDALFRSAEQIADDPNARHAAFVSRDSQTEGKAFAIALPFQVGGFASAWAVAAAGGALATAIGATIVGGAVGAGLGVLLLRVVARHHVDNVQEQLARGGLLVWVSTPDTAAEQRALDVMQRCGGSSVHAYDAKQEWGTKDSPLHGVQPDPFLEHDR